jgi:CRP-like cAMP-binding protein
MAIALENSNNRLLASLSSRDRRLLAPYLSSVELRVGQVLETPNRRIRFAYFVEQGLVSVIAGRRHNKGIEVGLIGTEGMTGVPLLLGVDRSVNETFIQAAGSALRLARSDLATAMNKSRTLSRSLLLFANIMAIQTEQTALANGRSPLLQRLARWILMMDDRSNRDDLFCTHNFLSLMLGVRRATVSEAVYVLEGDGLIRAGRGFVQVVNRNRLEALAAEFYGLTESEYARLIGLPRMPKTTDSAL